MSNSFFDDVKDVKKNSEDIKKWNDAFFSGADMSSFYKDDVSANVDNDNIMDDGGYNELIKRLEQDRENINSFNEVSHNSINESENKNDDIFNGVGNFDSFKQDNNITKDNKSEIEENSLNTQGKYDDSFKEILPTYENSANNIETFNKEDNYKKVRYRKIRHKDYSYDNLVIDSVDKENINVDNNNLDSIYRSPIDFDTNIKSEDNVQKESFNNSDNNINTDNINVNMDNSSFETNSYNNNMVINSLNPFDDNNVSDMNISDDNKIDIDISNMNITDDNKDSNLEINNDEDKKIDTSNYVISVVTYLCYTIIFLIPVVGIVFMIMKILDKKNENIRNFAISSLIVYVIVFILFLISLVSISIYIDNYIESNTPLCITEDIDVDSELYDGNNTDTFNDNIDDDIVDESSDGEEVDSVDDALEYDTLDDENNIDEDTYIYDDNLE